MRNEEPSIGRVALTGVLAWAVPGLGHIYLGDRKRGLLLLIVIAVTFWTGVAIGGVRSTVQPTERKAWFMAQICAGTHTLAAWAWPKRETEDRAGFMEEDVAVIFTGVAGLLNILIVLDALAASDPSYVRIGPRPPPGRQGTP